MTCDSQIAGDVQFAWDVSVLGRSWECVLTLTLDRHFA